MKNLGTKDLKTIEGLRSMYKVRHFTWTNICDRNHAEKKQLTLSDASVEWGPKI